MYMVLMSSRLGFLKTWKNCITARSRNYLNSLFILVLTIETTAQHWRRKGKRSSNRVWVLFCVGFSKHRYEWAIIMSSLHSPTNQQHLCCPCLVRHWFSSELWRTVMCVTKPAQQPAVGWRNHSAITAPQFLWKQLQAGDLDRPRDRERLFSLQWEAWLMRLPNPLQTACQHKSETAPSLSTCKFTSSAAQEGNVN